MKTCFKCGRKQPMECFYKHRGMADGHLNKCKTCTKYDVAKNYRDRHESKLAYEKRRWAEEKRRRAAVQSSARLRKKYKKKTAARRKVAYEVWRGRLVAQPCAHCGGTTRIHAHHHDYDKPLEIEWLCEWCHRKEEGRSIDQRPLTLPPGRKT